MKTNRITREMQLARAEKHVPGKADSKAAGKATEPAKPSREAIATSLVSYADKFGNAVHSMHEACKAVYLAALEAWEKLTGTGKRSKQTVNAFHKAFKPVIEKQCKLTDGTVRNLLADCRKANGLPSGKIGGSKTKGKHSSKPDVISIRINSEVSRFTLQRDGEEVENSVQGLYDVLLKLAEVYGETLFEAVRCIADEEEPEVKEEKTA